MFVENGRHLSATRVQRGLRDAVRHAGITGPDGQPLKIVAHQLRHTYATSLVNAGMSSVGGEFSITPDLTSIPFYGPMGFNPTAVITGDTFNFQCWFRDSILGSLTSNFTDAVSVTFH